MTTLVSRSAATGRGLGAFERGEDEQVGGAMPDAGGGDAAVDGGFESACPGPITAA